MGNLMTASSLRYVLSGGRPVGFLLSAGPKGVRAYDADGLPLGMFQTEAEAVRHIYEQAAAALATAS
jgi:serine phosphatase RsbU (regulator of sigma subunit)